MTQHLTSASDDATPLYLLTKGEVDSWAAGIEGPVAEWLATNGFREKVVSNWKLETKQHRTVAIDEIKRIKS